MDFDECKSQIGCKMQNCKNKKNQQSFLVFSLFPFQNDVDDVNYEEKNSHDAHRSVKNTVSAHPHLRRYTMIIASDSILLYYNRFALFCQGSRDVPQNEKGRILKLST